MQRAPTTVTIPDYSAGELPALLTVDPEVFKLFILNSAEHEIYPAHKC